jgi:hypothetical protein
MYMVRSKTISNRRRITSCMCKVRATRGHCSTRSNALMRTCIGRGAGCAPSCIHSPPCICGQWWPPAGDREESAARPSWTSEGEEINAAAGMMSTGGCRHRGGARRSENKLDCARRGRHNWIDDEEQLQRGKDKGTRGCSTGGTTSTNGQIRAGIRGSCWKHPGNEDAEAWARACICVCFRHLRSGRWDSLTACWSQCKTTACSVYSSPWQHIPSFSLCWIRIFRTQ